MNKIELAKKLSEAGFPLRIPYTADYEPEYFPMLSELIEACGKNFISLGQNDEGDEWRAQGAWEKWFDKNNLREGFGSSPEIAVANLWLALNSNH